ncbi:MAG: flagellar assembly protein H, partial [Acidobacteriota bacterium]
MQKHDALWKELLRAFFPEFLEMALPEVAAELDCAKRQFLEQESFTDIKDGRSVRMDLVAEVPALGRRAQLVIVHIEVALDFDV